PPDDLLLQRARVHAHAPRLLGDVSAEAVHVLVELAVDHERPVGPERRGRPGRRGAVLAGMAEQELARAEEPPAALRLHDPEVLRPPAQVPAGADARGVHAVADGVEVDALDGGLRAPVGEPERLARALVAACWTLLHHLEWTPGGGVLFQQRPHPALRRVVVAGMHG